jgi:hypothetical protein
LCPLRAPCVAEYWHGICVKGLDLVSSPTCNVWAVCVQNNRNLAIMLPGQGFFAEKILVDLDLFARSLEVNDLISQYA